MSEEKKRREEGIGFEWSEGETYLKSWSEPVFVFYDENGEEKEVGLGYFSPGVVQNHNPNSSPNRPSNFLEAVDDIVKHKAYKKMPENVFKIMVEFLSEDERSLLKCLIDAAKLKRKIAEEEGDEREDLL
jgi:hypothetical protein